MEYHRTKFYKMIDTERKRIIYSGGLSAFDDDYFIYEYNGSMFTEKRLEVTISTTAYAQVTMDKADYDYKYDLNSELGMEYFPEFDFYRAGQVIHDFFCFSEEEEFKHEKIIYTNHNMPVVYREIFENDYCEYDDYYTYYFCTKYELY